jgi:hypothetical protein
LGFSARGAVALSITPPVVEPKCINRDGDISVDDLGHWWNYKIDKLISPTAVESVSKSIY